MFHVEQLPELITGNLPKCDGTLHLRLHRQCVTASPILESDSERLLHSTFTNLVPTNSTLASDPGSDTDCSH